MRSIHQSQILMHSKGAKRKHKLFLNQSIPSSLQVKKPHKCTK